VPDTYEGAPLFTTIFLSVVVKLGLFFVLVKVLCACCVVVDPLLGGVGLCAAPRLLLAVGGLFSMFFGGFGALFQNRLKRLLAYSSIGNLGFALCGLTSVGVGGLASSITYMLVYSFSMLLLFTVVVKYRAGRGVGRTSSARYSVVFVTDVSRLLESGPYVGRVRPYIFISTLFSLAGIPPLAGFWAKYFVLESLVLKGGYLGLGLAAFAFGYSVLASFYYLNLIRLACHTRASYGVAPEEKAGRALLLAGLVPFRADCLRVSAQMVCWSTVLYGWVVLPQQFYRVVSGGLGPDLLLLNPLFQASASPLF
jgi:NADH-quinone oxidoreductase subunit N